jgi:hypothetical protein
MSNDYPTLNKLFNGEIVEIHGIKYMAIPGELRPGDLYIAEGAQGAMPLHVDTVTAWINPQEDTIHHTPSECMKVETVSI